MLTPFMMTLIERFPMGMVSTVCVDGWPAVSPKGSFQIIDEETVIFAHIRSPKTWANLKQDSRLEVGFFDPFIRKAVRLRGSGLCLDEGHDKYDQYLSLFKSAWPDLAPRIKGIVEVKILHSSIATTPPYDDGAQEADFISYYQKKYQEYYP